MPDKCLILIADDEETVLESTADLLRREGYLCDTATSAGQAARMLGEKSYDVLLADIKMPGNTNLELVRLANDREDPIPVILMTGYPSANTAIESIRLPVVDYLVKPVELETLLGATAVAAAERRAYRSISAIRHRLTEWARDIDEVRTVIPPVLPPPRTSSSDRVVHDALVLLAFENVVRCLNEVAPLLVALGKREPVQVDSEVLRQAIRETIDVLERSKGAFKSKTLGQLRRKLQGVLQLNDMRN